jgi:hypothetical protein
MVAAYAARHSVHLTSSDTHQIDADLRELQASDSPTSGLFKQHRVSPSFMRSVLRAQLLVNRVEDAITPKARLRGPSYRMRKFVFARDSASYREAVDLATSGVAAVHLHPPPIHWVAAQRLDRKVRSQAVLAGTGDYIGPFIVSGRYVVYEVLGHANHAFGKPARQLIEAQVFRSWLRSHTGTQLAECEKLISKGVACDPVNH